MNNYAQLVLLRFGLLLFCICIGYTDALAQETPPLGQPYSTAIESTGLYQQDHPESLGNGLYRGAGRQEISALLLNITTNTHWITQNRLLQRLLLTQADTGILENSASLSPEYDLMAARLKALLSLGMQNQAFDLYTGLENSEGHNMLHYYGVLSMLMSGEKALACVEIKTLYPYYKDLENWQKLNQYCIESLSDKPKENASYIIGRFDNLSLEDQALLVTEKTLDISSESMDNYSSIPARDIQALLTIENLTPSQRLLLTINGVGAGVLGPDDLAALYTGLAEEIKNQKRQPTNIENIAVLYAEMEQSWLKSSKVKSLPDITGYAKTHGHAALVPFMPMLVKIKPENLDVSFGDIKRLIMAAIIGRIDLPDDWSYSLSQMTVENSEEKNLRDRLIASSFLLSDPAKTSKKKRSVVVDNIANSFDKTLLVSRNIIENIDIQLGNHANVVLIYENKLALGENKSYKMPSYALLNAIKEASSSSVVSVILLSNVALHTQNPTETYSGVLGFICEAMNKIGLTKEARYILSEYILRAEE